jgi:hypothetical protein
MKAAKTWLLALALHEGVSGIDTESGEEAAF